MNFLFKLGNQVGKGVRLIDSCRLSWRCHCSSGSMTRLSWYIIYKACKRGSRVNDWRFLSRCHPEHTGRTKQWGNRLFLRSSSRTSCRSVESTAALLNNCSNLEINAGNGPVRWARSITVIQVSSSFTEYQFILSIILAFQARTRYKSLKNTVCWGTYERPCRHSKVDQERWTSPLLRALYRNGI